MFLEDLEKRIDEVKRELENCRRRRRSICQEQVSPYLMADQKRAGTRSSMCMLQTGKGRNHVRKLIDDNRW
jgi:hypothetical protein